MTIAEIRRLIAPDEHRDSWGNGVKRMVDACTEAKVPLPRYELRPGGVAIIFNRPKKAVSEADVLENVLETSVLLLLIYTLTKEQTVVT